MREGSVSGSLLLVSREMCPIAEGAQQQDTAKGKKNDNSAGREEDPPQRPGQGTGSPTVSLTTVDLAVDLCGNRLDLCRELLLNRVQVVPASKEEACTLPQQDHGGRLRGTHRSS